MKLKNHLLLCCSTLLAGVDAAFMNKDVGNWTDLADTQFIDNRWRLVLPYVIRPKFSDESARFWASRSPGGSKPASAKEWIERVRPEIKKAAKFFEPTNVVFKEYSQADIDSDPFARKQYIVISDFYDGASGGCSADLGPSPYENYVEVDIERCREDGGLGKYQPGRIVSELMHIMGFINEHQRPDRDQFLSVKVPPYLSFDYMVHRQGKILTAYDPESITHYGASKYLKINPNHPKSVDMTLIGQRDHLSELDIQSINMNFRRVC